MTTHIIKHSFRINRVLLTIFLGSLIFFASCEKYDDYKPVGLDAKLELSASSSDIVLQQKGALKNAAVTYSWTTGSNRGTGASITYSLQVDKQGNNFSKPVMFDMGKANYSQGINTAALNDSLLGWWGCKPDSTVQLEARIIATINSDPLMADTSKVITISVEPYLPVTKQLFIVGDATPTGWDIASAIQLTQDANEPTIFVYKGGLKAGHFKFPVNRNTDWGQDMYMRNTTDSSKCYLHHGGNSDDNQWEIKTPGNYQITISLCDSTIKIATMAGPGIDSLFMVGDATPNGWDISNATKMTQSLTNQNVFTYDGILTPGDFKFPVNRNTDWGQNMYERDPNDSTKCYLHIGGQSDDNKWHIYKTGWYHVAIDLEQKTIVYTPLTQLYIIGSATDQGWNIGTADAMTADPNGYVFTYSGHLTAGGEFKFPVNQSTSWGQDMFMKSPTDATKVYFHHGGDPDDNKWTVAIDGNYLLTIDLKAMTLTIQQQ